MGRNASEDLASPATAMDRMQDTIRVVTVALTLSVLQPDAQSKLKLIQLVRQ